MFKRYLSITLVFLLAFGANATVFAQKKTNDKNALDAEKIKAAVEKRGTSEKKKIIVKMLNGTKLKGYISQIGDDSFTLTDSKTKQQTVIAYRDAARINGTGLSGGAKIGIIAGVGVVVAATVLYLAFRKAFNDAL